MEAAAGTYLSFFTDFSRERDQISSPSFRVPTSNNNALISNKIGTFYVLEKKKNVQKNYEKEAALNSNNEL